MSTSTADSSPLPRRLSARALPQRPDWRSSLLFKGFSLGLLSLLLLVPLAMIRGLVAERQMHGQHAIEQVAASSAQAQTLTAPVLVVPYVEQVEEEQTLSDGGSRKVWRERQGQWLFFPTDFRMDGTLAPQTRELGLHKVRVYALTAELQASFDAAIPDDPAQGPPRRIGQPQLRWGIADVRGVIGTPSLQVQGQPLTLLQGAGDRSGVHALLPVPTAGSRLQLPVRMQLEVAGTQSLAVTALADSNQVQLASAWPHPQFNGAFLPRQRQVGADGFQAQWQLSALASQAQAQYRRGIGSDARVRSGDSQQPGVPVEDLESFGVSLLDPVNVYLMSERATKYAFLFVLLTFGGFLLLEVTRRLRVHPIQYGLVGIAQAMFFLLLLGMSEHIAFAWAYLLAAVACLSLLAVYVGSVLGSRLRGLGFAAALGLLYAALYGLLISEDNALVLGAGLMFVLLALVMLMTRRIDWYRVSVGDEAA